MPARENFVTHANDQRAMVLIEPATTMIRVRRALFQSRVCSDHFPRHEIRTNAEMLERALRLRSPEFVRRHWYIAQRIFLDAHVFWIHDVCLSAYHRGGS